VGRTREAVDTAVLASAIGVDRSVKTDVGRVIAGNNLSGRVDRYGRLEWRKLVERSPAVIKRDAGKRFVAPGSVALRTPPSPALVVDDNAKESTDGVFGLRLIEPSPQPNP